MSAITPIDLRVLQNKAGVPPYPDSPPNTIYAEDWNPVRDAISKGASSISTKGIVLGSSGLCTLGSTPVALQAGQLIFQNAEDAFAQVGYISNDGELGMARIRADQQIILAADVDVRFEGSATRSVPETAPTDWHMVTSRGAGQVEDFEVFHNGSLEVIRKLTGDYAADKIGSGYIMRHAGGLSRIRMNAAGEPVIEDVDDYAARPITYTNERRLMTGTGVFVDDVTADPLSPIVVTEPTADPKVKQVGLSPLSAAFLAIGAGASDVNVDALAAGGGGVGVLAELTSPAEVAQISSNALDIAAIQAELLTVVKSIHTSGAQVITPDVTGKVTFVNSSSVLWDKPATNKIRAVASGGGGGGGAVNTVTGGAGIVNSGTAADPVLVVDLKVNNGLVFDAGELTLEYAGSGGDFGTGLLPARSDHLHDASYSPLGHTHPGFANISDITYGQLALAGDVGTAAGTLAAGDDGRFHTQGTDLGTTLDGIFVADSARGGAAPAAGQRGFGVERGSDTNAVMVFDDASDSWKAGLEGSPVAIIIEGDARLTDARTPLAHALSGHVGSLAAAAVVPAYVPTKYSPASGDVDGHLSGIDSKLGTISGSDEETFVGFASSIVLAEYLVGDVLSGRTVRRAGTINYGRLRADVDIPGGALIEVTVSNLTTPASATITLSPTEQEHEEPALGIPFLAGELMSVIISNVVGAPGVSQIQVELVRE